MHFPSLTETEQSSVTWTITSVVVGMYVGNLSNEHGWGLLSLIALFP